MEPGDRDRLFIIERSSGKIKILRNGQILPLPFPDISGDLRSRGDGGHNYGWAKKEGAHCFQPPQNCDPNGLYTDPIAEYQHSSNPRRCAIIGGSAYRGKAIPRLAGQFFYAELCSSEVFSILHHGIGGSIPV